jgi:hypothetical protein
MPKGITQVHFGDVNVSADTIIFADDQIPTTAVNDLVNFIKLNAVPFGIIVAWSGSVGTIPAGWRLCDGTNGTPNLKDRFIVGANATFAVGAQGGSYTHIHNGNIDNSGAHDHTVTVDDHTLTESQIPAHKHGSGILDSGTAMFNHGSFPGSPGTSKSIDSNGAVGVNEAWTTTVGGGAAHNHGASSGSAGNHNHTIDISEQNHLPPYYALAYIMRSAV